MALASIYLTNRYSGHGTAFAMNQIIRQRIQDKYGARVAEEIYRDVMPRPSTTLQFGHPEGQPPESIDLAEKKSSVDASP